jgi:hypothetical protein
MTGGTKMSKGGRKKRKQTKNKSTMLSEGSEENSYYK